MPSLTGSVIKTPFCAHSAESGSQSKCNLPGTHNGTGSGWPRQPKKLESSPAVGQAVREAAVGNACSGEETASINSVFALRTQMLPPTHTFQAFRSRACLVVALLELYPARLPPHPPPQTPQTSFDKYSWITQDGPKGQGPETLSAFYLRALKSTLCFWGSRQASRHTKAALFLHMWRLLIRINDFFFIVAADKLVCRAPFC